MIEPLTFTVYGHAQPAGSKRTVPAGGKPGGRLLVIDDNPNSKNWKQEVRSAGAQAMMTYCAHESGKDIDLAPELLTGPLSLDLRFYLRRPQGHWGSGRNADKLRASAPRWPVVKPDVTKLTRAIEDALTGVVWRDDAQVITQVVGKFYGEPERVVIAVFRLGQDEP